jgi:hypothetical protein
MTIRTEEKNDRRVTYDDMNQRIYYEEICCTHCRTWVSREAASAEFSNGELYCENCLPDEEDALDSQFAEYNPI